MMADTATLRAAAGQKEEEEKTKGWLPSAKLKPTFPFLGRDFAN